MRTAAGLALIAAAYATVAYAAVAAAQPPNDSPSEPAAYCYKAADGHWTGPFPCPIDPGHILTTLHYGPE